MILTRFHCFVASCLLGALIANAAEVPRIAKSAVGGQLIVNGKPYLILGGELGNSSAGTAAQADSILPQIAKVHVNTVLMPVAWEQIEPVEGSFDFSILEHPGTRKLADRGLKRGTGSNAAMDLGFAAWAERQGRREKLQEEALSSP